MKLNRSHCWDLLGLLSLALLVSCVWLWASSYGVCDIWIVTGERAAAARGEGSRWVYGAHVPARKIGSPHD